MHTELKLNNGVTIRLKALNQFHTYEGLLEGVPTQRMNKAHIESAMALSKKTWNCKSHLIEPVETPIEIDRPYPFGVPAHIPPITCVGLWSTTGYERDGQYGCMQLALVWCQAQFALPIDECVLRQILEIDWESVGEFYEY
jgi:hypothetical protein